MNRFVLSGLALLSVAASASAQVAGFNITGGNTTTFTGDYTFGYKFDLAQSVSVTKLGWNDLGTWTSSNVGIFNRTTGALITSATVSSTSTDILNGFKYVTLGTPVTLSAGQYTIGGTGRSVRTGISTVTPNVAGLTFQGGVFKAGGVLGNPTTASGSGTSYFGPNFQAVPEPSTMIALGVAGLAVLRRRRKA